MIIASRTPEGEPQCCPICDKVAILEPSDPGRDLSCPSCGSLFWRVRSVLQKKTGRSLEDLRLSTRLRNLDSLDLVDLIMTLEEECHVTIPDRAAAEMQTVEDAIRYIVGEIRRREGPDR
jgi:acyl carrier protein